MLVIFDWDGTIIDSAAKIVASMQQAASACSVPVLADADIRNIIGLGLPEALLELYPQQSLEIRQRLQKAYAEAFVERDCIPCEFFDGVEDVLDTLTAAGHTIAVATGKSRQGLNRVLQRLQWQNRFHATKCADETASKPHPLMLQQLLNELGFAASDSLMVGDTEYDLAMANNAGIPCVAVSYGAHAVERLQKHKPIAIIDNFSALLQNIA